jgi:hypothetical protein
MKLVKDGTTEDNIKECEVVQPLAAFHPKLGAVDLHRVRNRMPVSLRGGGGELGNLKP